MTHRNSIETRLRQVNAVLVNEAELTQALADRKIKFSYHCALGHLNTKTIPCFNLTAVCKVCSGRSPESTRKRLIEYIAQKGGTFDSNEYKNANTKITVTCRENHTWLALPAGLLYGQWCPRCSQRSIEQAREQLEKIVHERCGSVNIDAYRGRKYKISFTCRQGHVWETTPGLVVKGRWCPRCSNCSKEEAQTKLLERVKTREGWVDIDAYVTNKTKILFKCKEGHEWSAVPKSIVKGSWCPKCGHRNAKTKSSKEEIIDRILKLTESKMGNVDVSGYANYRSRLWFNCEQGHRWQTTVNKVFSGTWCPNCSGNVREDAKKNLLEVVKSFGGSAEIDEYKNFNTKIRFTCKKRHSWFATPNSVSSGKSWCLICAGLSTEDAKNKLAGIVSERKGIVDLEKYAGANKRLLFQCSQGHSWHTTPSSIMTGTWCGRCIGVSKEKAIEDLEKLVSEKGGWFDKSKYKSVSSSIEFKCHDGHIWSARPGNVKHGTWCPFCTESMGERTIRKLLMSRDIKFESEYLLKPTRLRADFYIPSRNLIIEFDGEQHFTLKWRGRNNPNIRVNDLRKNLWCRDNNIHILRIPFWTLNIEENLDMAFHALSTTKTLLEPPHDYFEGEFI